MPVVTTTTTTTTTSGGQTTTTTTTVTTTGEGAEEGEPPASAAADGQGGGSECLRNDFYDTPNDSTQSFPRTVEDIDNAFLSGALNAEVGDVPPPPF